MGHYFCVLNHLSIANSEASSYILNKKIIGRFYAFFFDKCGDKQVDLLEEHLKLKDMSDCAYRKIAEHEIKQGGFKSRYMPKKRNIKSDGIFSISHMNLEYFWKTLSDLLPSCTFSDDNNNPNLYKLSDLEIFYLRNEKQKHFVSIWESADNLKVAKSIANIYAIAAKEDGNYTGFLSKTFTTKIFQIASDTTLKNMLKGLWSFLFIQDSFSKLRVETFKTIFKIF